MKIIFLFVIAVIISQNGFSGVDTLYYSLLNTDLKYATQQLDELSKKSGKEEEKLKLKLIELELKLEYGHFNEVENYLLGLGIQDTMPLLKSKKYLIMAKLFRLKEDWHKAKINVDKSIKSKTSKNIQEEFFIEDYNELVWYFQSTQLIDSAFHYGAKAISISKGTNRSEKYYLLAKSYSNYGYSFHYDRMGWKYRKDNPFSQYMDSAQFYINQQRNRDLITEARILHNRGNHSSVLYNERSIFNRDVAENYYDKSFQIIQKFNNPYYNSLNHYVKGYNLFTNLRAVEDSSIRVQQLDTAIQYMVKSLNSLIKDGNASIHSAPQSIDSEIPNFINIIVTRLDQFHFLRYKMTNDKESLKAAYSYADYYIKNYKEKIISNSSSNETLLLLSSYQGIFYQKLFDYGFRLKDELSLENTFYKSSSTKNYVASLSYLSGNINSENFIERLQNEIDPNQAIVEYFVLPDKSKIYTVIIEQNEFNTIEIDYNWEELVDDINQISTSSTEQYYSLSNKLFERLFHPIEPLLSSSIEKITIVPDLELSEIPFEGLVKDLINKTYLINQYQVNYEMSTIIFLERKQNSEVKNFRIAIPDNHQHTELTFSRNLGELLNDKFDSELLTESNATDSVILKDLDKVNVFHLSSHMETSEIPFYNKAIASSGSISNENINYQNLGNMNLAVLHGCNSLDGKYIHGLTNIGREFIRQGCNSLIQTIWEVDDQYSSLLLNDFYDYIYEGYSAGKSLHLAKLNALENNPVNVHPRNWAAFVFYGLDNSIELPKKKINYLWIVAIVVMILILIFGWKINRKYQLSD